MKAPTIGGPTSNLRNLAGHLLMSGSSSLVNGKLGIHGASLNNMLLKKNTDLQASVNEQLMIHQQLQQKNKTLERLDRDQQMITGF